MQFSKKEYMVIQVFHRDFGSIWAKLCISSVIFKLFLFLSKYTFPVTWLPKYLPNWGIPLRNLLVILFVFPRKCQGEQMAHAVWPEGQEIQALTNCIQKHIVQLMTPCWDCLASSSICHERTWTISSSFWDGCILQQLKLSSVLKVHLHLKCTRESLQIRRPKWDKFWLSLWLLSEVQSGQRSIRTHL